MFFLPDGMHLMVVISQFHRTSINDGYLWFHMMVIVIGMPDFTWLIFFSDFTCVHVQIIPATGQTKTSRILSVYIQLYNNLISKTYCDKFLIQRTTALSSQFTGSLWYSFHCSFLQLLQHVGQFPCMKIQGLIIGKVS